MKDTVEQRWIDLRAYFLNEVRKIDQTIDYSDFTTCCKEWVVDLNDVKELLEKKKALR